MSKLQWLSDKTGGHCAYCGCEFTAENYVTADHVVARSNGGDHSRSNKVPCCLSCNATKGKRSISYLRDVHQRRLSGRPAFSAEQLQYLERNGFEFPAEPKYVFYWERIGNAFPDNA